MCVCFVLQVAEPNGNTSSEEGKASVKNSSVKEEQKVTDNLTYPLVATTNRLSRL